MDFPAQLYVPEMHQDAFRQLAGMAPDAFATLIERLSKLDRGATSADILKAVAESPDASTDLGDAILASDVFRSSQGLTLAETTAAIATASATQLDAEGRDRLVDRLGRILAIQTVWFAARAFDMGTAHPRSMQSARIITDIRPLFAEDVTDPPPSAIISQTLTLRTYNEDGRLASLYISLDDDDLDALESQIVRARKKAATLRGYLDRLGTPTHTLEKS